MKNKNPFPTTFYPGPELFCDRKPETESLVSNIQNDHSTTIIAVRRMGKTGLIRHVFEMLKEEIIRVYLDILPTFNQKDFINTLSSAIVNAVPERSGAGKKIMNFIKTLRPVMSFDPLTGNPQLTIAGSENKMEKDIESLLRFLNDLPEKVVIAIDEFQQIAKYPVQIDGWLRSVIQTLPNISFIFSGSRRHVLTELFADPGRPFYRSTQMLHFGRIPREQYGSFIIRVFEDRGRKISPEVTNQILDWTAVHTYYVQLVCNRLYANAHKLITMDDFRQETLKILHEQEAIFFQYRELLTKAQWNLLQAIAVEDNVESPTATEFITRYGLGSSAAVLRSLNALEEKEMIYTEPAPGDKKNYLVYDVLLRRWMQAKFRIIR